MNTFNDAPDSHFTHVMTRIQALNATREFFGPLDVMDWPPKQLEFEAFYLLMLSAAAVASGAVSSSPIMAIPLQWVWVVKGTDLSSGIRGRSRGDRGRKHREMMAELVEGLYPHFTEKKSFTLDDDTGEVVATSFDPVQTFFWTQPSFGQRGNAQSISESGVIYGYATVYLSDTPVIVTNQ